MNHVCDEAIKNWTRSTSRKHFSKGDGSHFRSAHGCVTRTTFPTSRPVAQVAEDLAAQTAELRAAAAAAAEEAAAARAHLEERLDARLTEEEQRREALDPDVAGSTGGVECVAAMNSMDSPRQCVFSAPGAAESAFQNPFTVPSSNWTEFHEVAPRGRLKARLRAALVDLEKLREELVAAAAANTAEREARVAWSARMRRRCPTLEVLCGDPEGRQGPGRSTKMVYEPRSVHLVPT